MSAYPCTQADHDAIKRDPAKWYAPEMHDHATTNWPHTGLRYWATHKACGSTLMTSPEMLHGETREVAA